MENTFVPDLKLTDLIEWFTRKSFHRIYEDDDPIQFRGGLMRYDRYDRKDKPESESMSGERKQGGVGLFDSRGTEEKKRAAATRM